MELFWLVLCAVNLTSFFAGTTLCANAVRRGWGWIEVGALSVMLSSAAGLIFSLTHYVKEVV
jgi:hypothetical protein